MARIRTIKPEFPQSESMGNVSRDARLCFVMLWTIADDSGRLRGNSRMLASLLFPYDDDAPSLIDGWMQELESEGCVNRYQVDGASYVEIAKWLSHQKIDKPTPSKLPAFDPSSRILANPRESSSLDQGPKDQRTKDQGPKDQSASPSGSRLPADWVMTDDMESFCKAERPDLNPSDVACRFADYWHGMAGAKGRKADWMATWRNWVRNEKKPLAGAIAGAETAYQRSMRERMQQAAPEFARRAPSKPAENVVEFFAAEASTKRLEIGNGTSVVVG